MPTIGRDGTKAEGASLWPEMRLHWPSLLDPLKLKSSAAGTELLEVAQMVMLLEDLCFDELGEQLRPTGFPS